MPTCSKCQRQFKTTKYLKKHICSSPPPTLSSKRRRDISPTISNLIYDTISCPLCDTRPFNDKTLCLHLRTHHKNQSLPPDTLSRLQISCCNVCHQIFSSLKKHVPGVSSSCRRIAPSSPSLDINSIATSSLPTTSPSAPPTPPDAPIINSTSPSFSISISPTLPPNLPDVPIVINPNSSPLSLHLSPTMPPASGLSPILCDQPASPTPAPHASPPRQENKHFDRHPVSPNLSPIPLSPPEIKRSLSPTLDLKQPEIDSQDVVAPRFSLSEIAVHPRLWRRIPRDHWPAFQQACRPFFRAYAAASTSGEVSSMFSALLALMKLPSTSLRRAIRSVLANLRNLQNRSVSDVASQQSHFSPSAKLFKNKRIK